MTRKKVKYIIPEFLKLHNPEKKKNPKKQSCTLLLFSSRYVPGNGRDHRPTAGRICWRLNKFPSAERAFCQRACFICYNGFLLAKYELRDDREECWRATEEKLHMSKTNSYNSWLQTHDSSRSRSSSISFQSVSPICSQCKSTVEGIVPSMCQMVYPCAARFDPENCHPEHLEP